MRKEVSAPVMAVIVVVFVVLVAAIGWFMINKPVPKAPSTPPSAAQVPGSSGSGTGAPAPLVPKD